MSEWAIVGVIITLVTFIIAICKPLMSLTKAITELTVAVGNLQDKAEKHEKNAHESHQRLWDYNAVQDAKIDEAKEKLIEHEGKIKTLEQLKERS